MSVHLVVRGMTCLHCRRSVEDSLRGVRGVWGAAVDLEHGSAEVECDPTQVQPEQLVEAIRGSGYDAEVAHA